MAEEIKSIIGRLHREARRLGVCELFTGRESTADEIFRLFKSIKGMEFSMEHGFPALDELRKFNAFGAAEHGIYTDAGRITITEPRKVVIAGDTDADVICSELNHHGTRIYLMHGARATVHASDWAVVKVECMPGCEVKYDVRDQARIL